MIKTLIFALFTLAITAQAQTQSDATATPQSVVLKCQIKYEESYSELKLGILGQLILSHSDNKDICQYEILALDDLRQRGALPSVDMTFTLAKACPGSHNFLPYLSLQIEFLEDEPQLAYAYWIARPTQKECQILDLQKADFEYLLRNWQRNRK